jgi:hypothetical protein
MRWNRGSDNTNVSGKAMCYVAFAEYRPEVIQSEREPQEPVILETRTMYNFLRHVRLAYICSFEGQEGQTY